VDEAVRLRFWAAVHSIETGEEKHLATFYIMNTSLNRNGWRVTDKALEEALPTLLGKPLGCIPGYRVDHVHQPLQVGRWVRVEKPDGYALATAEITDPVAWEKVSNGEWGPVSVVILAYRITCSVCGKDITQGPDEHVLSGEGHEVIESFAFDRVDFVSEPAYPQAGVLSLNVLEESGPGKSPATHRSLETSPTALTAMGGGEMQKAVMRTAGVVPFEETQRAPEEMDWDADAAEARIRRWAGGPEKENVDWARYRRAFAWYDSRDPENFGSYKLPHHDIVNGRLSVVWRGVAAAMQVLLGARGGVDIPEADRRGVYNHLARHYRQFGREPPEFHARSSLDGPQGAQGSALNPEEEEERREMEEIAELKRRLAELETENKALREKLEALEAERHMEKVEAAVEARIRAGLVRDREAEVERLKAFDDATLDLLREDAERVAEKVAKASAPSGPKARYTAEHKSAFNEAVEEMRERLFGYRKEVKN